MILRLALVDSLRTECSVEPVLQYDAAANGAYGEESFVPYGSFYPCASLFRLSATIADVSGGYQPRALRL